MANTAILHYSAAPVVGGVEAVIEAHAREFLRAGCPVTVIAGQADETALPAGAQLVRIPEMDTQHPLILRASAELEAGRVPDDWESLVDQLAARLAQALRPFDHTIVHNVWTKHFNLPLTAALARLLDEGRLRGCIAWCHDFTWTSPRSRDKVHPGYPWDLLSTSRPDITYVTISGARRKELAGLYGCPEEDIRVIYNGVDIDRMLDLNPETSALSHRLELNSADLVFLMPVRVTRAKNIELAIRLAASIRDLGIHTRVIISGPPDPHSPVSSEYFQELLDLRKSLGVEEQVRFVYQSGPDADQPYIVSQSVVNALYRLADVVLLPSHPEGFGMPVLEAGLAGVPVISTNQLPAAVEIGAEDVLLIDLQEPPNVSARCMVDWLEEQPVSRFRRRVRHNYSWQKIFEREIRPLITGNEKNG